MTLFKVCLGAALRAISLASCTSSSQSPYTADDLKARCETKRGKWVVGSDPTRGFCEYDSPR